MKTNRIIAVLAGLGLLALAGCESTTTTGTLAVYIVNAPAIVAVNQSVSLTAVVSNDESNGGVDWSCSDGTACGTFSPTHTADGATAVFTAPATTGTVSITATSTTDTTVTASASITVVTGTSNALLNGRYVFQVQGIDTNGTYVVAGTLVADGSGNITSGQQDLADESNTVGPDAVSGTYAIGSDGRGSITLDLANAALPNYGVETFSIALTSSSRALIVEFDGTATSSGTLDLQSSSALDAASIAGPYAFTSSGTDMTQAVPLAFGGVAEFDAAGGTVANGLLFSNDAGVTATTSFTGTMTAPDGFGRGTIVTDVGIEYVYYAVRGGVLRLVEQDSPSFLTGGSMYSQGAPGAGGTFSNASLTGDFVLVNAGGSVLGPVALAGQFTADGAGSLTAGFADTNDSGSVTSGDILDTDVYAISGDGTGTLTLPGGTITGNIASLVVFMTDPNLNLLDPNSLSGLGGALVLDFDSGAVGTGFIVPQTAETFQGFYSLNLQSVSADGQDDLAGRVASDGASGLSGTIDVNRNGTTSPSEGFSGAFSPDASHPGRLTGTFTIGSVDHEITYYQVGGGVLIVLDTDTTDVGLGALESGG
jgi:hypothetical protein